MKTQLILIMFTLGVVLTVHLAMNGMVGARLDNARVGNALFWCIGAVTAVIIGLTGWKAGALEPLKGINPWLLTAGCMGGCLVFGIAWVFPRFGAANGTMCLLAGQMISGLVLSQFGWLGNPQSSTTPLKLGAVALMFVAIAMMVYEPAKAAAPAADTAPAVKAAATAQADAAKKP